MPNARIVDYVVLVQTGKMTIDQLPTDIQEDVTQWLAFFSGKEAAQDEQHD